MFLKTSKNNGFIRWKPTLFSFLGIIIFYVILIGIMPNLQNWSNSKKSISFYPRIIDGDTIANGKTVYRLVAVDACEMGQPISYDDNKTLDCGYYAKAFLTKFVSNNKVTCYEQGQPKSYGRVVARCFLDKTDGYQHTIHDDLGHFLLNSGWGISTNHGDFSYKLRYYITENAARSKRHGAWAGKIETAKAWRDRKG